MKKLLINALAILIVVACSSPRRDKKENKELTTPFIVDIEKNLDNVQALPVSLIAKQFEYIPLETNKRCLLKKVDKIAFTDSFIFVSDFSRLLQFNRKGKFIRQIGRNGKGPGEYIYVMAMSVNEKKSSIYIRDYGNQLKVLDFDGRHIESFPVKYSPNPIVCFDDNKIAYSIPNAPKTADPVQFNLFITDDKGKILKEFKNNHKRIAKQGIIFFVDPLYVFDRALFYKDFGSDTLFAIKNLVPTPYAIFRLGSMKMNVDADYSGIGPKKLMENLKSKLWITNIRENTDCLFITLAYGLTDSLKYCFFQKQKQQVSFLNNNTFWTDDNIPFWPKYIYNDNILVDYMDASDFREHLASAERRGLTPALKKITQSIKDEDNPVLIIGKQ